MTSEKKIAANRLNAKKSTGPKTHQGKFNSSLNSLKTGLHSKNPIVKDVCELRAIYAEYAKELSPATIQQRALVRMLAQGEWQNRRYARLRYAVLKGRPEEIPGGSQRKGTDELDRVAAAMANIQESMQIALKWLRTPAIATPVPTPISTNNQERRPIAA